jgi:predicted aspartyl protease
MRLCTAALMLAFAAQGADLKGLYDNHQWFELRDALRTDQGIPLYRIAVAAAFNDSTRAEEEFRTWQRSAKQSDFPALGEAVVWIAQMHVRNGRYQFELPRLKLPDMGVPNLAVAARGSSSLQAEVTQDHYLIPPVSVNGQNARLALDTGAGISIITESEARRLGLTNLATQLEFTWFAGAKSKQHIAVAKRVAIGNFEFHDVAFGVIADEDLARFSRQIHGAIGLSLLLAIETIRWSRDGELELGFPSSPAGESNLCFDNFATVARIEFQQRKIYAVFDTGNPCSKWWPPLSRDFPKLINQSSGKKSIANTGGNTADVQAAIIPQLPLRIGGFEVTQNDAPVLQAQTSANSAYYHGNLGFDLLRQARRVTLDFKSLALTLE